MERLNLFTATTTNETKEGKKNYYTTFSFGFLSLRELQSVKLDYEKKRNYGKLTKRIVPADVTVIFVDI